VSALRKDTAVAAAGAGARTPARAPSGADRRPRLFLVRRPSRQAARTPFVVLLLVIGGVGLVGLLLINTRLQQGALAVTSIDRENQSLRERAEALAQEVDALSAPQRLSSRARELGMVPNPGPAFIRLSDGAVLGVPVTAGAPASPPAAAPASAAPAGGSVQ